MNKEEKTIKTGMQELSPVICELLRAGGRVRLTVTGNSMYPMLRDRKDSVVLKSADEIRRWDVPLYRRDDGKFVLHRVVKVKNGVYTMCGDNQTALEAGIRRDQILAVATEFSRDGKTISCQSRSYRLCAALWGFLRPLRPMFIKGYLTFRRKLCKRREGR